MLGEFTIERNNIKQCYLEMEEAEKAIEEIRTRLEQVQEHLTISGKGTYEFKGSLKEQSANIKKLSRSTHTMKESLEEIVRVYGGTEAKLSGSVEGVKILAESVEDIVSDIANNIRDTLKDWIEESKENRSSVVFRIKDDNTRNGFSEDYRNVLQELYEDVPSEYGDTKKLYDRYSKEVVVAAFNKVDENGKASPYHSNGKLYLNTNADLMNKRGNGTTYYHEYGHFVVYKEGWVDGNKCTGEFKKFEDSLRKEVATYYQNYETQFRKEGIDKGYSGAKLDKYIENQTKTAINTEINGSSREYYDVNNGISDIIDGVSNGKYQPSYGHGDGYWDKNQSRVANEAFAQFFSAQMTGDIVEIEKMKEIMPETYEIYTNMIENAARK